MSVLKHPDFDQIKPYIRVIPTSPDSARPRCRIELDTQAPADVRKLALRMVSPCVHCGKPMSPFRRRVPRNERALVPAIYFAAACPMDVSIGCSRGKAATAEYRRIEETCS